MTKRQKRKTRPLWSSICVPLPKKTGGAHTPKTAYRRKREKDVLRKELKEGF